MGALPKRLFPAARSRKRGRAKRISRLPLKGGAKAGCAKIFSGYLYAGGFSISLSDGISRLESGAFLHVLSVVDASTSGVRAGPTAPQLNPMFSHEHNMEAADKASIAKMAFFIVGVKRYRPAGSFASDFSGGCSAACSPRLRAKASRPAREPLPA